MTDTTDELFITRKRKKYKFAHFDSWSNCFDAEVAKPQLWPEFFTLPSQPLVAEVGAGTADLSIGLAQAMPNRNYVALDVKSDRLYTGARFALQHNLDNIAFARAQVTQVHEVFASKSLTELWVTFPDPFPRKRQAKHRLTHPAFLRQYQKLLAKDGVLRFKTDNRLLFLWSLEQIVAEGWHITELSFDLHDSDLPANLKITTIYERRFMAEGTPINYVKAIPANV